MADSNGGLWALVAIVGAAIYFADDPRETEAYGSTTDVELEAVIQEDDAVIDESIDEYTTADELVAGETYAEYDVRRDEVAEEVGGFDGYGCTEDCSGHSAGYDWAMSNGISDPEECGGKSWSFREGCVAYAEEMAASGDY